MASQTFSIYILDFDWNYLFVNAFACKNLKLQAKDIIGRNMWSTFDAYNQDPHFLRLKAVTEKKVVSQITTVSPVTGQRISITSYPLTDCYYFAVSILPNKASLLDELRQEMAKKSRV